MTRTPDRPSRRSARSGPPSWSTTPARCPCRREPPTGSCATPPTRVRRPPGPRAATSPAPRCWPSSTPTASPSRDGSKPCSATSRTSGWRWWRPGCATSPDLAPSPATRPPAAPSTSARARPGWRPPPASPTSPRRRWSCGPPRSTAWAASTRRCAWARTSTSCGGWWARDGAAGTSPGRSSATAAGTPSPPSRGRGSATDVPPPPWTGAIPASSRPPSSSRGRPRAGQPSPPAGRWPGCWPASPPPRPSAGGSRPCPSRDCEALRLAALGFIRAGEQLASCVTRVWWPLALAASLVSRRTRRPLLAAAALPVVIGWVRTTGGPRASRSKPWAYAALRAVDDLSYGAGVWAGALEERRPGAILPRRPEKVRARSRRRPPPTGARR